MGCYSSPSPDDRPNKVDLYSLYRVQAQSPESRVSPDQRRISTPFGQFGRGPGKHPWSSKVEIARARTFILKRKSLKFILDVMDAIHGV